MESGAKRPAWHLLNLVSEDMYILCTTKNSHVRYAPLYVVHVKVATEAQWRKAERRITAAANCAEAETLADKLRLLRLGKGLTQEEIAHIAGVTLNVYRNLEQGITQKLNMDATRRLETFYGVQIADETETAFALFLIDSPGRRIQAYRESLSMGRGEFSKQMGIPISSLQAWETGRKKPSRQSWKRYFEGKV